MVFYSSMENNDCHENCKIPFLARKDMRLLNLYHACHLHCTVANECMIKKLSRKKSVGGRNQ